MKFGLDVATTGSFADARLLADLAVEAERAGWDGFFVWDVLTSIEDGVPQPVLDPTIALTAIALATTRIRIGAMVTILPRRLPWQVAREAASLDQLSGGRLVFGAGIGSDDREFARLGGLPDRRARAEQLDESLAIIDGLWRGEEVAQVGAHYRLDGLRMLPRPVQRPRIPIWCAAGWPRRKPLRRAARWDGVYLMTVNQVTDELLTPAEVVEIAAVIRAARTAVESFDIAINGRVPAGVDPADHIRPYALAGMTWWIELCSPTPEAYRERIRRGPPA